MRKHHIIILMHYLELGGAEMALLGLLNALNPDKVNVDLFIYSHQGPLMKFIPSWVNLLPEVKAYSVIEKPLSVVIQKQQFGILLGRIMAKLKHRLKRLTHKSTDDYSIFQYIGDFVTPFLPTINPTKNYDLCISFLTPHNIGRDKVKAQKKIAWIHTDYSSIYIDTEQELKVWKSYDKIAAISIDVKHGFISVFPALANKIFDIENILPLEYIRSRASEEINSADYGITNQTTLLSVGRLSYPKNFDNVPNIARRIMDLGVKDLKWYIIGFGGDEQLITSKIKECDMEKHVILLGKKDNPYPYIKACDIYVQPSRYEGKSVTVREAQILCKPVAITAYPTATSQIRDGIDGLIVPLDNEDCAHALAAFIKDKKKQNLLIENCKKGDFCNMSEVEKIYDLLK